MGILISGNMVFMLQHSPGRNMITVDPECYENNDISVWGYHTMYSMNDIYP